MRYKIAFEYDPENKLFVPMYKKHWWNRWKPWTVNYFAIGYHTLEDAAKSITESGPIEHKY